jgi:hypothetical protein
MSSFHNGSESPEWREDTKGPKSEGRFQSKRGRNTFGGVSRQSFKVNILRVNKSIHRGERSRRQKQFMK